MASLLAARRAHLVTLLVVQQRLLLDETATLEQGSLTRELDLDRTLGRRKGVEILDLRFCAQRCHATGADRDIHVDAK